MTLVLLEKKKFKILHKKFKVLSKWKKPIKNLVWESLDHIKDSKNVDLFIKNSLIV